MSALHPGALAGEMPQKLRLLRDLDATDTGGFLFHFGGVVEVALGVHASGKCQAHQFHAVEGFLAAFQPFTKHHGADFHAANEGGPNRVRAGLGHGVNASIALQVAPEPH